MTANFNDLPWHDATLKYIYINREDPGTSDVIKLLIDWPDGSSSSTIEFCDCYSLHANMNFGIVADESILTAECVTDSKELKSICQEWSKAGVNLEKLKCFKIITNSTNSIINIYALNFKIEDFNTLDCKND